MVSLALTSAPRKSHLHRTQVQVSRGGNLDTTESDNARDDLRPLPLGEGIGGEGAARAQACVERKRTCG